MKKVRKIIVLNRLETKVAEMTGLTRNTITNLTKGLTKNHDNQIKILQAIQELGYASNDMTMQELFK